MRYTSKIVSQAATVMDKVINQAFWWMGRQPPDKIRNGELDTKPGDMIKKLSPEDRQALADLKSDDLSSDRVDDQQAKMWADHTGFYNWKYYTNMLKEAKLAFDAKIIKRHPSIDRKKY